MVELLLLSAVLGLAVGSLFIKKSVPAMISFASMMFLLGVFYILQDAKILGLFQIFIYTGGIVVLMLFGITIIGVEFPKIEPRAWSAVVSFLLFVAMSVLFFRGVGGLDILNGGKLDNPSIFADGYADMVILFALIGSSLLYATVKMASLLNSRSKLSKRRDDV